MTIPFADSYGGSIITCAQKYSFCFAPVRTHRFAVERKTDEVSNSHRSTVKDNTYRTMMILFADSYGGSMNTYGPFFPRTNVHAPEGTQLFSSSGLILIDPLFTSDELLV